MIEEVNKALETNQILANNTQFSISNWVISIIYLIVIIISMIILLISLVQFTYWLSNIWVSWYKFSYKKPTILLLVWLLLVPIVFIIMTLINLLT
jgi:hypothetical protein